MTANQRREVNGAWPITILLFCSLLFALVGVIFGIVGPDPSSALLNIFAMCAGVLLLAYVFGCHGKRNLAWIVPAAAVMLAVLSTFTTGIGGPLNTTWLYILLAFPMALGSLRGMMNKKLFFAPLMVCAALNVQKAASWPRSCVYFFFNGEFAQIADCFPEMMSEIIRLSCINCAFVALMLFGMMNEIPWILRPEIGHMRAKEALGMLNNQRYFGEITEEEYQSQRAQVIQRL